MPWFVRSESMMINTKGTTASNVQKMSADWPTADQNTLVVLVRTAITRAIPDASG